MFEHGLSYVCEKSVGPDKSCDFRSGKIILQQHRTRQMTKLLAEGKTELLRGFVSARTNRKFSAFLKWDPAAGRSGFEFEPTRTKAPKAGAAAAKAWRRKGSARGQETDAKRRKAAG